MNLNLMNAKTAIYFSFLITLIISACSSSKIEILVAPDGTANGSGTKQNPLSFAAAIEKVSQQLKKSGLPEDGINIIVTGGHYRFERPVFIGDEFK